MQLRKEECEEGKEEENGEKAERGRHKEWPGRLPVHAMRRTPPPMPRVEVFTLSHITHADSARTHRLHTDLFGRRLCQLSVRVCAESTSTLFVTVIKFVSSLVQNHTHTATTNAPPTTHHAQQAQTARVPRNNNAPPMTPITPSTTAPIAPLATAPSTTHPILPAKGWYEEAVGGAKNIWCPPTRQDD
ncbi:hypothetical protein BDZ94DRAFT_1313098 [Collybia nuda]|uniref:Uncharacterized protein n=1 Tax=Collybia nuda TaxID=64659 RepID=A0A9P6CAM6_9AGAR|nr:hypothetical protein BDZ94DRAFT_1313098 [Collybia nuda]